MMKIGQAADAAAALWGGTTRGLLSHRENAVFEMVGPFGRAALRLHRPGYQSAATIRAELWWTAALAKAGVPVAAPLPTQSGQLLVQIADDLIATAVCWVEGHPLGVTGKPFAASRSDLLDLLDLHVALGRVLAQLHRQSDALQLPPDFERHRWDADGLAGEAPLWGRFWDHPAATPDERAILLRTRDALREWLSGFDGDFGLIHADLLRENVFVNGRSVSLIDFDDAGFGYRLYDLGTAMLGNLAEPAYPDLLAALVSGYCETCPSDPRSVELFTLARACASVGWTMPRVPPTAPVNRSHIQRATVLANWLIP
jgi:Ser/Thr protein kinase RdoA (MazF antagonist)